MAPSPNPDNIRLKRAYDEAAESDGTRILVDRLWPRGVKKADAELARWMKDIAPSTELRKWFGHDPDKWDEFHRRYSRELASQRDALDELRGIARNGTLTLVYSAHDAAHNQAVVLRDVLLET